MTSLRSTQTHLQQMVDDLVRASNVPGYVAGVLWDGETLELASGTANMNTGAPMTPDTAFLLGSITKPMVTSLLMRFVERGAIRLEERVIAYLPELRLGDEATREVLTVRHLLNHTCGIDAADFFPELGKGDDGVRRYVAALAGFGQVHPLGEHISYCNAAFVIAGRLLEVLSGEPFDGLLKRELFGPCGFTRTRTSGDEAILHRTAIGHIVEPATGVPRATRRFMLPYAGAPAGTTVITTIGDLLRFARIHIGGGVTPEGMRVLSGESARAMATETAHDPGLYDYRVGLGWQLPPFGGTHVLAHMGGSYGGVATIIIVPEQRFAYAAFGNSTTARPLHDRMHEFVLEELLGVPGADRIRPDGSVVNPARYVGIYERQYIRTTVEADADGGLTIGESFSDPDDQRAQRIEYSGVDVPPPVPVKRVTETLFVPADQPIDGLTVPQALGGGWTFLDPDERGWFQYVSSDRRISRRR
jgi:CubicO group peptidase (beta-lactamase class C family)